MTIIVNAFGEFTRSQPKTERERESEKKKSNSKWQ